MGMWILLTLLLMSPVFYVIGLYNKLIRLRNQAENAWSQIDVQLQRRHDLIPNLIATVKGYMDHERQLFENITKARSAAMSAKGVAQTSAAEGLLGGLLGRLMVAVENYPDLKASGNFLALQEELASTENKIAFARQCYNDGVMQLNAGMEMFPGNIVANLFRFTKREFFELDDAKARNRPDVGFVG